MLLQSAPGRPTIRAECRGNADPVSNIRGLGDGKKRHVSAQEDNGSSPDTDVHEKTSNVDLCGFGKQK